MAEHDPAHGEIDWASAEVADGRLTVAIAGEPSKDWAERVAAIVERLQPASGWSVNAKRTAIEVEGVAPGSEAEVRHLLEGAVLQANADFAPDEDEEEEADAGASEEDAAMTEAFRAFGDAPAENADGD